MPPGIFNAGANIGAVVAPLAVPLLADTSAGNAAFMITGGAGLHLARLLVGDLPRAGKFIRRFPRRSTR